MAVQGRPLILDWSAYVRVLLAAAGESTARRLTRAQLDEFAKATLAGELHVCPPFRLEARYSARGSKEFAALTATLDALPQADADGATFAIALAAQAELARKRGTSHRIKPVDLLVAAIAHQHELGVLHYDRDYDTLAAHTSLDFESVWIAPRGSVD